MQKRFILAAVLLLLLTAGGSYWFFFSPQAYLDKARKTGDMLVFQKVCGKLTDSQRCDLALTAEVWGKRRTAAESIEGEAFLEEVAANSRDSDIRWAVVHRITNLTLLKQLAASDPDESVHSIAGKMRDLLEANQPLPPPPKTQWHTVGP